MSVITKTLATCKPTEFLRQTVKIKRAVQKWLKDTDIMAIIRTVAPKSEIPENATDEEKAALIAKDSLARRTQFMENFDKAFGVALEEYPDETLEILALCCFIEPENADDYRVADYLTSLNSLISDKTVIDFFISLAQLGQMNISDVSRA